MGETTLAEEQIEELIKQHSYILDNLPDNWSTGWPNPGWHRNDESWNTLSKNFGDDSRDSPVMDYEYPYKIFVQPKPEHRAETLESVINALDAFPRVDAKFIPFANSVWDRDYLHKIVIYPTGITEMIDMVRELNKQFKWKLYTDGSAPNLFDTDTYSKFYGAMFTQQVSPLVHIRKGNSIQHPNDTARVPHDVVEELRAHSIDHGGLVAITVYDDWLGVISSHALDPNREYTIGKKGWKNQPDIVVPSRGASVYHGKIKFDRDTGLFVYKDNGSKNGSGYCPPSSEDSKSYPIEQTQLEPGAYLDIPLTGGPMISIEKLNLRKLKEASKYQHKTSGEIFSLDVKHF
ncbi:MAG: FHA domain-containing protein [Nanoarchaeota archaeon]|nr:FHA domain-containing protein [Nanoarchaeota archaeon]